MSISVYMETSVICRACRDIDEYFRNFDLGDAILGYSIDDFQRDATKYFTDRGWQYLGIGWVCGCGKQALKEAA